MAERPRRLCTCGKRATFSACQDGEDNVVSQFVCQRGTRIPGGGHSLGGCGKQGPEVHDAYSDRATAAAAWDAMIRNEINSRGHL